jgi:signal transduction histidine kinase
MSANGKDYLNRMNNAAKRMRALINDVLAYSRTKSVGTKSEKVNLAVVITEVKNEFAEIILEKNAVIEVGELGDVWINISQFKQLLINLLANALKFCKPGVVPRIKISGKIAKAIQFQSDNPGLPDGRLSPQQIYYQLTISDNGIGFDPQYKDKIFEVFQRLHSKEEYEGTGIGLAIVKKIAENHNGTITARSETGKGATFDIYLPVL